MNRTVALGLVAAAIFSVGVDLAVGVSTPGLYSLVGFGGTVLIVVITKQVGKRLLLRPEGSRVGDPRRPAGDDVEPTDDDPQPIDGPRLTWTQSGIRYDDPDDEEPPHTADPAGTRGLPRYREDPTSDAPERPQPGGADRG
ncbi:hypothetical protein BH23ACT2_BH23ACT2_21970 [soil metagenome]